MKLLNSLGHSKKSSLGFRSQLGLQDSEGEMLQESGGVLAVVQGAVEQLRK